MFWLIRRIADNFIDSSLASKMRRRRFELFKHLAELSPKMLVLDVGDGQGSCFERFFPDGRLVTVDKSLHSYHDEGTGYQPVQRIVADGRYLPFNDKSFDIAFSNSVIEHGGKFDYQNLFATEIQRVARHHFLQTPNRRFPIEPHYLVPFAQYWPNNWLHWLSDRFSLGWISK